MVRMWVQLKVVSLYDFTYYVVGQEPAVLCILPFGMLCLSAISMMFVQLMLTMCMMVDMVV